MNINVPFKGQIVIYEDAEKMADKVNEYFDGCFGFETDKKTGKLKRVVVNAPTRAGLILFLGFTSKKGLDNFCEKQGDKFKEVREWMYMRLEDFLETQLVTTKYNPKGAELALKNICGWEDTTKKEIEQHGTVGMICGWSDKPLKGSVVDYGTEEKQNKELEEETPIPVEAEEITDDSSRTE